MSAADLEREKRAVLERIEAHRLVMGKRVDYVRRSFGPVTAARAVLRTILPLIRPVSGLARSVKRGGKGRIGLWLRVGLVASMFVPVVRAMFANRGDRREDS